MYFSFKYLLHSSRNTCVRHCYVTLLLTVSTVLSSAIPSSHHHFSDPRQAEFVKTLKDYEISIPAKVDSEGKHVSHSVHHTLEGVHSHVHRRDLTPEPVHYRLNVDGMDIHMTLTPHHRLFAPGLVVERRSSKYGNISDSHVVRMRENPCHFTGHIKGHENSAVAMATCEGLRGLLRTSKGDYFIEPVKGHNHQEDAKHPHLVYKRSAVPEEMDVLHQQHKHHQGTCGVSENGVDEIDEREKWQKNHQHEIPSPKSAHSRHKRSYSIERNVETLVVVDTKMVEYYENDNLENYVLTIMNMVATLYHDSTLGNAVNIVLVRLILLEQEDSSLKITHHADNTLISFCRWQQGINPQDEQDPNHHDVAILLTRFNICSRMDEPCSTLGLAQVAGMCQPHRSCSINEDSGLVLAYTVAHELGHNFGMQHDSWVDKCEPSEKLDYVMYHQLSVRFNPIVWSNCSRTAITKFLDRDWGYCLNDEPSDHDFEFPYLPPGVMYDINHQCRLKYGPSAHHCEGIGDTCSSLWCAVNDNCVSNLEPPAFGTLCGENHWCVLGHCEVMGETEAAINGEWGGWSSWSGCSRTCGAGVAFSERHCDNPPPSYGGNYCLGERKRYRICNTEPCDEDAKSFRQVQCEEFNTVPYKGRLFHWDVVSTPATPCQLHCKPTEHFFSVMLKDMVTDGTPCSRGARDMCISGICKNVGCDWIINSTAKEDRCGICHGDGSSCKTVKDEFKEENGVGYVDAMEIPEGARNIRVNEVAEANNYLAVRNSEGKFYLNGDWFIQWSGDYEAAGTVIHYKREGNKESFLIPGPTKENLKIVLLFQSQNPGVSFEYVVPNDNETKERVNEFSWKHMDWTTCTSSCGGGYQRQEVVCVEKEAGIVDAMYCNKSTKPNDLQRTCNDHQCPARWWPAPWQHCSATCGKDGVRRRTVICIRSLGPDEIIALDDFECDSALRPKDLEPCHHKSPCPDETAWKTGPWQGACNGDPCEVQSRTVECFDQTGICDGETKPIATRKCTTTSCGNWTAGEWTTCTRTCGGGVQYRSVKCVNGEACLLANQPADLRECKAGPCPSDDILHIATTVAPARTSQASTKPPKPHVPKKHTANNIMKEQPLVTSNSTDSIYDWDPLGWEKCSKSCGQGVKQRQILCVHRLTRQPVEKSNCINLKRPLQEAACEETACQDWEFSPWSQCSQTCGEGIQHRTVSCPVPGICDPSSEPATTKHCDEGPCVQWVVGNWGECSVTCGGGEAIRNVQCVNNANHEVAKGCDPLSQPINTKTCNPHHCSGNAALVENHKEECKANIMAHHVCKALKHRGQCSNRYIQQKCCQTCHEKPDIEGDTGQTE